MTSFDASTAIVGLGAATPVGRTLLSSAAAVRAGVSGFGQHPFMVNALGTPMTVAAMPWIDPARGIVERMGDALLSAIDEALGPLQAHSKDERVTLLVNLPPSRPGLPEDVSRRMEERLRQTLHPMLERLVVARLGHAGCLWALQSACQLLASAPASWVVIAGVDSYIEPDQLEWLEQTEQLHGGGERNNAWGFVPGEGAGAMLLASARNAQHLRIDPISLVRSVGLGREERLIGTGEVCLGLGLTAAFRDAVGSLAPGERVSDVYCDMNGEPYRADEFGFTVLRTRERFMSASDFVAPADCWGDVGAASVPLAVGLACVAAAKNYARGRLALVWASSVNGRRGAAVLDLPVAGSA